jgi:hypothetical protein
MKSNSATADFNYCHYTGFRLRPLCCWIVVAFLAATPAFSQPHLFLEKAGKYQLTEQGASFLASLPMRCWEKEFPYKTGITFLDSSFITTPKNYHPAFYGCFDWHSSVHGHWMLVKLLREFPAMPEAASIRAGLKEHLSAVNLQKELFIFRAGNLSFERIYGWAWLLYLQRELTLWDDPLARELQNNLKPLADFFSQSWQTFLNKIAYPIRVGEHTNLAFGLSLSWDYAQSAGDTVLQRSIREAAARFYAPDKGCPIAWEPGGYDFLSPCLEEARLMSRLLYGPAYLEWLRAFLPGLFSKPADLLKVGIVRDRSDGKLVHLDGLNFSRAWCLLEIAEKLPKRYAAPVQALAARHLSAALPNVVSGNYAGEHWLASFAVYALSKEK